ncbi:sulfite reductase [Haematobacter massiliensis]|uniref:Sulfite reductase n=1 Tax=Haematobacter massiliensis TaxID=195105 RepID=A0A086Y9Y8_9RHOB|nr:DUF2849 domain-containing protein [Haematobacter massiliensis]KFI31088.1 sulfite reductase [Haematobacter massiliensis]OWJ69737.1 sulfite reductase [Haematobacter massiliensis]OWJ88683.1 sulfite reductase [Haematobacter massiliensis]QBJ23172.1 DUF2849 domain-containing protein [Haematobacter massiliensis]
MSRRFTPKVVTANALLEGDVVYLTPDDRWSRELHEAELIEDEAHAAIRLLDAAAQSGLVVGAYLADAKAGSTGPEPIHFREVFRATGPSNYPHGKQAERDLDRVG